MSRYKEKEQGETILSNLRVNDLFCGAGGMGLGFKQAGFRLGGAWDFDKWAVESYGNNVSPKVKQADITLMTWDEMPYADVWTFGFPCQDLSVAGKQAGMIKGQTRSGLFFEVMRLLEETEQNQPEKLPKIIMAENVKGLKKYLPVLEEEYNARGYEMYYTLYNSKYWGVPQNRERYFVVGVRKDYSDKPFQFPIENKGVSPLSEIIEKDVDERYYLNENHEKDIRDNFNILRSHNLGNGQIAYPVMLDGATYAVTTRTHACYLEHHVKRKLATLIVNDKGIRKLTPKECAKLQGFPNNYKQEVSDSQFYKQTGNAVTVNVANAIAERIKTYLENL